MGQSWPPVTPRSAAAAPAAVPRARSCGPGRRPPAGPGSSRSGASAAFGRRPSASVVGDRQCFLVRVAVHAPWQQTQAVHAGADAQPGGVEVPEVAKDRTGMPRAGAGRADRPWWSVRDRARLQAQDTPMPWVVLTWSRRRFTRPIRSAAGLGPLSFPGHPPGAEPDMLGPDLGVPAARSIPMRNRPSAVTTVRSSSLVEVGRVDGDGIEEPGEAAGSTLVRALVAMSSRDSGSSVTGRPERAAHRRPSGPLRRSPPLRAVPPPPWPPRSRPPVRVRPPGASRSARPVHTLRVRRCQLRAGGAGTAMASRAAASSSRSACSRPRRASAAAMASTSWCHRLVGGGDQGPRQRRRVASPGPAPDRAAAREPARRPPGARQRARTQASRSVRQLLAAAGAGPPIALREHSGPPTQGRLMPSAQLLAHLLKIAPAVDDRGPSCSMRRRGRHRPSRRAQWGWSTAAARPGAQPVLTVADGRAQEPEPVPGSRTVPRILRLRPGLGALARRGCTTVTSSRANSTHIPAMR
jgi:hypothetical protein